MLSSVTAAYMPGTAGAADSPCPSDTCREPSTLQREVAEKQVQGLKPTRAMNAADATQSKASGPILKSCSARLWPNARLGQGGNSAVQVWEFECRVRSHSSAAHHATSRQHIPSFSDRAFCRPQPQFADALPATRSKRLQSIQIIMTALAIWLSKCHPVRSASKPANPTMR